MKPNQIAAKARKMIAGNPSLRPKCAPSGR